MTSLPIHLSNTCHGICIDTWVYYIPLVPPNDPNKNGIQFYRLISTPSRKAWSWNRIYMLRSVLWALVLKSVRASVLPWEASHINRLGEKTFACKSLTIWFILYCLPLEIQAYRRWKHEHHLLWDKGPHINSIQERHHHRENSSLSIGFDWFVQRRR